MEKENLAAYAMKRVAAGAHLPTPWLFEPAKRPDDKADYCLGKQGVIALCLIIGGVMTYSDLPKYN